MLACPFSYQPSTLHSQAVCTHMPRVLPLLWLWNYYVWQWYNRGWFILRLQSVVFCSLMQTGGAGDCTKDLIHGWCLLPSAPQTLNTKAKMTMNEWWGLDVSLFFFHLHKFFTWLSMPMDGVLCSCHPLSSASKHLATLTTSPRACVRTDWHLNRLPCCLRCRHNKGSFKHSKGGCDFFSTHTQRSSSLWSEKFHKSC